MTPISPRTAHATVTLLALAFAGTLAAQTTVTVPCAADNTLYESPTGALSNGAGPGTFAGLNGSAGKRRAMLRFDVAASVPAGARILAASLSVNVSMTGAAVPIDVTAHRVLQAWGEGTSVASGGGGGGAAATPGDATWLHSMFPTTFWSTPGGDFAPTPSFTMSTPPLGIGTSPIGPGSVTDVQFWLDTPAQNFGWLLKTDELLGFTARRFDSRESLGIRPTLTVTYLASGQAGTWGTGCPVGAGTFGFAYVGAPIGGTTIQLAQSNGPANAIGANFFSLALDPIGTTLLPSCNVYLPLAQEIIPGDIFVLNGAGAASSPFSIPAGFPGFLVTSQSAAITNNTIGFVLSNAGVANLQ